MHPASHLALSWLVGCRLPHRRERVIVAWAGMAPDVDAGSILFGLEAYGKWHHVIAHGLPAAIVVTSIAATLARENRRKTAALAFAAFHLHLFSDFFGSGPGWGITYLWPLSTHETFSPVTWALNSWQNLTITTIALGLIGFVGVRLGRTFAESFLPRRADAAVVDALRARFGVAKS